MSKPDEQQLARLYRSLRPHQPNEHLDARIRRQARQAVSQHRRRRLYPWLSVAAVMVLGISLVTQLSEELPIRHSLPDVQEKLPGALSPQLPEKSFEQAEKSLERAEPAMLHADQAVMPQSRMAKQDRSYSALCDVDELSAESPLPVWKKSLQKMQLLGKTTQADCIAAEIRRRFGAQQADP